MKVCKLEQSKNIINTTLIGANNESVVTSFNQISSFL